MTPDELREARRKLGLSTAGLAKVLRLGSGGARTVRRWESGDSGIPGPAQVAIEFMREAIETARKKSRT
jgi:DNA-binding transcriptional regulator YiaG